MNLQTVLEAHLEMLHVRHYSAATLKSHRHTLETFWRHLQGVGIGDWRDVSRDTIADYQRELLRHYTPGTVRVHIGALRSLFVQLENSGAILVNPTLNVPLPQWERRLPKRI